MTCSDACPKAASRAHLREEARCREEEARQQRLARWQVFQPTTRNCLERVEALGGPALAEALAEAIRSEREHPIGNALAEHYTGGVSAAEAPDSCFARCKQERGVACHEGGDDR